MAKATLLSGAASSTDSLALQQRVNSYVNFAERDVLNILDVELAHLRGMQGIRVLDIGCGRGNQVRHLLSFLKDPSILALDASATSIDAVKSEFPNVQTFCGSMDSLDAWNLVESFGKFDIVIAFFSIYYSSDLEKLLRFLTRQIVRGGTMLLAGFAEGNNRELVEISRKFGGQDVLAKDFMSREQVASWIGPDARVRMFANGLNFPGLESWSTYYKNYGLRDERIESKVNAEVAQAIKSKGTFHLSKTSMVVNWINWGRSLDYPCASGHCFSASLPALEDAFQRMLANGTKFITMQESLRQESPGQRLCLLRHDVDFDLEAAAEIATLQHRHGIKATYFVMVSGENYPPFNAKAQGLLKQMLRQGHEIGVHHVSEWDLTEGRKLLQAMLDVEIVSCARHDPVLSGNPQLKIPPGMIDAYDLGRLVAQGFEYVSDSGKMWRKHDLDSILRLQRAYLLLHPESWVWGNLDIVEMHDAFHRRAQRGLDESLADTLDKLDRYWTMRKP